MYYYVHVLVYDIHCTCCILIHILSNADVIQWCEDHGNPLIWCHVVHGYVHV